MKQQLRTYGNVIKDCDGSIQILLNEIKNNNVSIKIASINLLSEYTFDGFDTLLSDIIENDDAERELKLISLRIAGQRKSKICAQKAIKILEYDDVELVCEAIILIQNSKVESLKSYIERLCFHPSIDIRERAVYALTELGGKECEDVLIDCLYDTVDIIKIKAIYALAKIRSQKAFEKIMLLRYRQDSSMKKAVKYYEYTVRKLNN